jgi:propionyl-CoA carboxylase beta chain
MAEASGWVPLVCAILGEGWTGPASVAGMSDFVVAVRGTSNIALAGPPLVKVAMGKTMSKEELGDPDMQATQNGIVDLVVDTEAEAIAAVKRYLSYLPANAQQLPPVIACDDPVDRREDALLDLIPSNLRMAYDVRKVLKLIVDTDSFFEMKPSYAKNLVTAFARLNGKPVGILASQPNHFAGTIDAYACEKGAHFISICNAFGLPMVHFIDTPGFLVGPEAERTGLSRRTVKLLLELGRATVPLATVVMRKGYGLGYIAMNGGRSFDSELVVAWPTAEIAAMSVEGGVNVAFKHLYKDAPDPDAKRLEVLAEMKSRTGWAPAAEGFGVDDVIDPRDTRGWLIDAFAQCRPRRLPSSIPKLHPITPL